MGLLGKKKRHDYYAVVVLDANGNAFAIGPWLTKSDAQACLDDHHVINAKVVKLAATRHNERVAGYANTL